MSRLRLPSKPANYTPLKCVDCHLYLSVPPVALSSLGYHCGRCITMAEIENEPSYYHAVAYESIAKTRIFSCQNDAYGCKEKIIFDQVAKHEEQCKFKAIKCPAMLCDTKIVLSEILPHYKRQHKNLILEAKQFNVTENPSADCLENKLLIVGTKVFIMSICTSLKNKELWFSLRSIEGFPEEAFYQVRVKASNALLVLNPEPITKYNPVTNFDKKNMNSLDLRQIKNVLKGSHLTFFIKLINSSVPTAESLVDELECMICKERMAGPIYNCTTGHSLCCNCKKKLQQCPFCKATFEGGRNFALEEIINKAANKKKNPRMPSSLRLRSPRS